MGRIDREERGRQIMSEKDELMERANQRVGKLEGTMEINEGEICRREW